jgi:hypothetical protein
VVSKSITATVVTSAAMISLLSLFSSLSLWESAGVRAPLAATAAAPTTR